MNTHSLSSRWQWRGRSLSVCALGGLLVALILHLLAFSPVSVAAAENRPPLGVARAGASLVRLVATYTVEENTADATPSPTSGTPQATSVVVPSTMFSCTGLGVIFASWAADNELNTWILTDGNVVTNDGRTCASSRPNAKLSRLFIYFSTAFNEKMPPIPLQFDIEKGDKLNSLKCQTSPCKDGVVAFSLNYSHSLPFISVVSNSPSETFTLGLAKNEDAIVMPEAVHDGGDGQEAGTYRTPVQMPGEELGQNRLGMPVVNNVGDLVGLYVGNTRISGDRINAFIKQQLPELQKSHENTVNAHWKSGVTNFYQKRYEQAQSDFQSVVAENPQFQGADLLRQEAAQELQHQNTTNTENQKKEAEAAGLTLFGFHLPYWLLIVAAVFLILVILLIWVSLRFGRARSQKARMRKFQAELEELERLAEPDAARIKQEEEAQAMQHQQKPPQSQPLWEQQKVQVSQGAGNQASVAPGSFPAGSETQPAQAASSAQRKGAELTCPACGAPVQKDDNFCTNCRQVLSPSTSGVHYRISSQPLGSLRPANLIPADKIAEMPTAEMPPKQSIQDEPTRPIPPGVTPSSADTEKTVPFDRSFMADFTPLYRAGTASDPGIKRKHKPNEDSLFAAYGSWNVNSAYVPFGLFIVADGMGGHAAGRAASRLAIQTIVNFMLPILNKNYIAHGDSLEKLLVEGVQRANQAVHQNNMEQRADMGTTMTAALLVGANAYVANVGDSRTYLYRPGTGLKKITNDHSVVASLVEAGIIKPDDIYTHPKRNQIYRSLGEKPMIEVDSFQVTLQPGDKMLLCSDGLWDMVRDPQIESILAAPEGPEQMVQNLIQAAFDGGGEDNVSVVFVELAEAAQPPTAPSFQVVGKPDTIELPPLQ